MPALNRRHALALGLGSAGVTLGVSAPASAAATLSPADLEATYDVTLGLVAVNLRTGARIDHRPDQRFPLLSTFKTLASAAVLRAGVDLDEVVRYSADEVVDNSPISGLRRRMTYGELVDAAVRFSDNTAGNLLLRRIGGPSGLTRFARSIGDRVTRLDRWETDLNEALPGDPRDTTTPAAIARSYQRLLLGDALATRDRWLLRAVLTGNTTSVGRFRAGLPPGWWFADKTGSGGYGTANDVGVVFAPDGTRILVAAMSRTEVPDRVADPQLMIDVARLVIGRLATA